jgi:hypothetical protein
MISTGSLKESSLRGSLTSGEKDDNWWFQQANCHSERSLRSEESTPSSQYDLMFRLNGFFATVRSDKGYWQDLRKPIAVERKDIGF